MDNQHNLLVVGLPEAGKTSFILAVDEMLQDPPSSEALRSYGLAADRTYLDSVKARFRAGKDLERTQPDLKMHPPELWFEDPRTKTQGRIFLPDLSGETFQNQWIDRKWTVSFRESLRGISGALVFVRADTPSSNQELLGQMIKLASGTNKQLPFEAKKASPQVQLVDVLQFIALRGEMARPLKTALMISAWDTVEKVPALPQAPEAFLAKHWSLLDQYFRSNTGTFATRIYGVSARGASEKDLNELRKLPPQQRVKLIDGDHRSRDLTRPLRWLLGSD